MDEPVQSQQWGFVRSPNGWLFYLKMAKRFTDTEIWAEDWFLDLPNEYKLLWNFALAKANHAGVWRPNKVYFSSFCGQVDLKKAVEIFNSDKIRVIVLESGNWFFPSFFAFQYGSTINENSKVHESILKIFEAEKIDLKICKGIENQIFKDLTSNKPQNNPNHRVKDKDKDKVKEKDKEEFKEEKNKEKGGLGEKTKIDISKISEAWAKWIKFKKDQFRFVYKSEESEELAKAELLKLSKNNPELALKIVERSMKNNWKGLFEFPEESKPEFKNNPGLAADMATAGTEAQGIARAAAIKMKADLKRQELVKN